jgi:hypothetical protein
MAWIDLSAADADVDTDEMVTLVPCDRETSPVM